MYLANTGDLGRRNVLLISSKIYRLDCIFILVEDEKNKVIIE